MVSDNNLDISESLFGKEPSQAVSPGKRNKQLQYWHKCGGINTNTGQYCPIHLQDFGWVTLGPVMGNLTAIEYTEFQTSKHATPMTQYGQYEVGMVKNQKYNVTSNTEMFKAIIELGGLKEFPVDQMIAYNWHRIEPIRDLIPELADVVDIRCEHGCVNRLFTSADNYTQHVGIMHRDVAGPKAIGEQFSRALDRMGENQVNMQGVGSFSPEQIAQIVAATVSAMRAMDAPKASSV